MTNEEIKADIVEACRQAKARGFDLWESLFTRKGVCGGCALTAIAFTRCDYDPRSGETDPVFDAAWRLYGWDRTAAWNFARGFDAFVPKQGEGGESMLGTVEYKIGMAVRAAVLP